MKIVGAIPAAGFGARLQPLEGSKELIPIRGTPAIDYLVERMRTGGATELRVVTRREKSDLVEHATALGARVILASPRTVSASIAAAVRDLEDDHVVLIGFPDTLWEPADAFRTLVDALDDTCEAALGLFRPPTTELPRSDVVVVSDDGWVERVDVKPSAPLSDSIWGCAAARVRALAGLTRHDWPGGHFDALCRKRRCVRGVALSDRWIDIGTPEALERARSDPTVLVAPA